MTTQVPSAEEIRRLPIQFEAVVPQAFIDHNGHMNVSRFLDLHIRVSSRVLADAGAEPDRYAETHQFGFFTVEHHVRYLSEVRSGQQLAAYALLMERSQRSMRHMTFLMNEATGLLASYCETTVVHVDHRTRRSTPLPADLAQNFDQSIALGRRVLFGASGENSLAGAGVLDETMAENQDEPVGA